MLKKTITFKDLDGNPITEDFYFQVNKAEIAELELSQTGGLSEYLKQIVEAEDGAKIMKMFKDIIMLAVGRRSDDGRRFIKNDDIRDDFMQTDAFSELFMELCTDATKGAEFVKGVMPSDLAAQIDDIELPKEAAPSWVRENREPTPQELLGMSKAELQAAFVHKAKLGSQ